MLQDENIRPHPDDNVGRGVLESKAYTQKRDWTWRTRAMTRLLITTLPRTAYFLIPSVIQDRLSHDPRARTNTTIVRPGPTAYLDGMRGLAALFVFFCHLAYTSFMVATGWQPGQRGFHLLRLPFIRLFFSGPPMVCIFFVISGYALSLKPLKQLRARNTEGFAASISSLTFRRAFRLFLPCAASLFGVLVLSRLGLYDWTREFAYDKRYMRNYAEPHYQQPDSLLVQLGSWVNQIFYTVQVWDWRIYSGTTEFDLHLWTIAVEFRCSMALFLTLVGTARLRTGVRFAVVGGLSVWAWFWARWDMLLFWAGMLLAEWDIIRGARNTSSSTISNPGPSSTDILPSSSPKLSPSAYPPTTTPSSSTTSKRTRLKYLLLHLLSLFLLSQPDAPSTPQRETAFGWSLLTALIPRWWQADSHRYYQSLGAILFVFCVSNSPSRWWQRRVFNTAFVQYLGRVSFALYLVHGPVLHTFGYGVERAVWGAMGTEGWRFAGGFAVAGVVVVPVTLGVADAFWRGVDRPVVRFGRWVEGKCIAGE